MAVPSSLAVSHRRSRFVCVRQDERGPPDRQESATQIALCNVPCGQVSLERLQLNRLLQIREECAPYRSPAGLVAFDARDICPVILIRAHVYAYLPFCYVNLLIELTQHTDSAYCVRRTVPYRLHGLYPVRRTVFS